MLTTTQRELLAVALGDRAAAVAIADALDAAGDEQGVAVANLGASTNLTALVVAATAITSPSVTATNVAASNFTAGNAAEPTKAEIDAGIDTVVLAIEGALDLKADNADILTMETELEAALLLKSDNADVEILRTEVETRLDTIEAKLNALLTSLRDAALIAT